ncbi:hypothetical protein GPALN_013045 [Globodera pallida]|nr:hypothetical protein GPALN_013045 [Globodera pallida]
MCTKPSNFVVYKDSADDTFPKFYDIDGDVGLLEFRVLLFSVDQSVGTLLASSSFDPVQQQQGKIGDFGGILSNFDRLVPSSSLAANFVEFGDKIGEERLEEQMTIRWAENVPRPAVVGRFGEGTEDEQLNGGRQRETDKEAVSENVEQEEGKTVSENVKLKEGKTVSENAELKEGKTVSENAELKEGKTVSENAELKEGKTVSENAELKALPKEGTERRRRVHSALSRRIFTIFDAAESHAAEPPSAGEEFVQQRTISSSIRQRKIVPKDSQSTPKDPIQILSSSDQQRMNRRSMVQNEQRMCIMAYLGTDDFYDASEEYLLWELRMLNAHRLITDRDLDEIRTVNCAKTGKTFRAQLTVREPTVFDEIPDEVSRKECSEETGDDEGGFEVPERNDEYWLHYMIEIGRGIGFAHDNLRVQWQLELPENCQYLAQPADSNHHHQNQQKSIQLNGRTQRCVVKSERTNDVAHFGHPIEFTLNYGPRQNVPTISEALDIWPKLLIRVIAEDSWGRIHVDGQNEQTFYV